MATAGCALDFGSCALIRHPRGRKSETAPRFACRLRFEFQGFPRNRGSLEVEQGFYS
jgi:hypothetical protein